MKNLFYRLASGWSFTKFFMHAQLEEMRTTMFRKKFLPLLLIGLVTLIAERATAQDVPPWDLGGFDFSWDGTWGSTISCSKAGDATNTVDSKSLTQSATVQCTITEDNGSLGPQICELDISYSRTAGLGTNQCQPAGTDSKGNPISTLTDVAFCGNASSGLAVTGTLNCNPNNLKGSSLPSICGGNTACTAQLGGITSVPNGQCSNIFPPTADLLAGQVLNAQLTSRGTTCTGPVVDVSKISTRFCNSGIFNPAVSAKCGTGNKPVTVSGNTQVFLPVNIDVSPQTINVSCSPNKDNGNVTFTIFGSETVDVTQIDTSSLELGGVVQDVFEGVLVSSCDPPRFVDKDNFLDLQCTVPSCSPQAPSLGKILDAERTAAGTKIIPVTVTGSLLLGNQIPIEGEDTVKTSP